MKQAQIKLTKIVLFSMVFSACSFGLQGIIEPQEQIFESLSKGDLLVEEPMTLDPTVVPSITPLATSADTTDNVVVEKTPVVDFTPTPNPYLTETPSRDSSHPPEYNPLTGQMAIYPDNLLRSPLMVKISNYPRDIRPQAGLSKADIVFEYYIGAFMNRFLAIFYGENAEWAGPIRSGRLIDGQLAQNYHSALVYGGADDRVNEVIKNPDVLGNLAVDTRVYSQCPPLCGTETHSLEGLYVNTAGMSEALFTDGYDTQLKSLALETVVFSGEVPDSSAIESVEEVEIIFSEVCRSKWIFDETDQQYVRWEEESDGSSNYVGTFDLLTPDRQIRVANIMILFSDYVVYDSMLHDVKIHYADTNMPARFFRNGKMIQGYWSGLDAKIPLQFLATDGSTYALAPGKSWIIFVTDDSFFSQVTDTMWRLEFTTP